MPTYEYKCKSCNQTFEVFQNINEKALEKCSECGAELTRVFHPVGVIFKGSGFYTTDYKKKEHKQKKKAANPKKADKTTKKESKETCSKKDSCQAAGTCK